MELIVVLLILMILILVGLCSFLFFYYVKINKTINIFLEKGKVKDVKEILFSHIEKTKKLEVQFKEITDRIKLLENTSKISLQKLGVVRFNPFGDMGGNQSFAIALLDSKNNGFIISSLFTKEGSRVYAKAVLGGKSPHLLSVEEKEAIVRAMGSENYG